MHLIELTDLSSLEAIIRAHHRHISIRLSINENMEPRCVVKMATAWSTPRAKGSRVNLNVQDFHLCFLRKRKIKLMRTLNSHCWLQVCIAGG